jgi:hypothetical protein
MKQRFKRRTRYKRFEITLGTIDDEFDWNDLDLSDGLEEILPKSTKLLAVDSFLVEDEKWMDDLLLLKINKKTS